jgi:PAS domain S-box-containing protein
MGNLKQYDEATAKYHKDINIKKAPIFSWEFHHEFLNEIKNSFLDISKLNNMGLKNQWEKTDWDFKSMLKEQVVIVTDAKLKIVFASKNIINMNGYREEEVVGNSPKMFHGAGTDQTTSREIRTAIELRVSFEKTVLNYKKNGQTYLCVIKGFPIFNKKGDLSHFIAFEKAA